MTSKRMGAFIRRFPSVPIFSGMVRRNPTWVWNGLINWFFRKYVIYLQKLLYNMETVPRTQTAFRLKDSLLERIKWREKQEKKSVNAFVEEVLEEEVGQELVFPKLSQEWFEQHREETERFVLKGAKLLEEYGGLDAFEQAELDKKILADALYEKYITRT